MEHNYVLICRDHHLAPVDEKAIKSLLFAQEIEFDHTGHVGKDTFMQHYFKFKDR